MRHALRLSGTQSDADVLTHAAGDACSVKSSLASATPCFWWRRGRQTWILALVVSLSLSISLTHISHLLSTKTFFASLTGQSSVQFYTGKIKSDFAGGLSEVSGAVFVGPQSTLDGSRNRRLCVACHNSNTAAPADQ